MELDSENKQTRKEVKKVISEIKHEVSTALQQIQSLQSEESHYGNLSGSRGQETHQNAKTSDTSQFNSLQVKSDSQEKDKKQKFLYNREGSTSSLTSTSDNEGPSVKSQ